MGVLLRGMATAFPLSFLLFEARLRLYTTEIGSEASTSIVPEIKTWKRVSNVKLKTKLNSHSNENGRNA